MSKGPYFLSKAAARQEKTFAKAEKQSRKTPNTLSFADNLSQISSDLLIDKKELNRLLTSTDARSTPTFVLDNLAAYFAGKPDTHLDRKAQKYTGLRISGDDVLYKPKKARLAGGAPNPFEETYYNQYLYVGNDKKPDLIDQLPKPGEQYNEDSSSLIPNFNWQAPEYKTDVSMSDPKYQPGGDASSVDGGATGFRRKRSSARTAGLTSKGTSQFKISGQSARSSGLNIGA